MKQKIVRKKDLFLEVYTGIDKTRKRAVDEELISKLYNLKLDNNDSLSFTRDIFIFSYCMRGMSFVDIAYLKKTDISNGIISYCRRKTGQLMNVRIESCMQYIINRYMDEKSEYIFPIIKSDDKGEAYKQYRSAINIYNRNLGVLSDMIGSGCKLSSYTAVTAGLRWRGNTTYLSLSSVQAWDIDPRPPRRYISRASKTTWWIERMRKSLIS